LKPKNSFVTGKYCSRPIAAKKKIKEDDGNEELFFRRMASWRVFLQACCCNLGYFF